MESESGGMVAEGEPVGAVGVDPKTFRNGGINADETISINEGGLFSGMARSQAIQVGTTEFQYDVNGQWLPNVPNSSNAAGDPLVEPAPMAPDDTRIQETASDSGNVCIIQIA